MAVQCLILSSGLKDYRHLLALASYRKAPIGVGHVFCLTPTDEDLHSATIVVLCVAIVCVCVCVRACPPPCAPLQHPRAHWYHAQAHLHWARSEAPAICFRPPSKELLFRNLKKGKEVPQKDNNIKRMGTRQCSINKIFGRMGLRQIINGRYTCVSVGRGCPRYAVSALSVLVLLWCPVMVGSQILDPT